jgi:hypothetical protein
MLKSDSALRNFISAMLSRDTAKALRLLAASPDLATASFRAGATRKASNVYLLREIPRYIFAGDTALHIAAAAYRTELVRALLRHGADVHAANRLGYHPIHSAAVGIPGSPSWDPAAQSATIRMLIDGGADPNATDKRGVSPLHQAVRTRCAAAVQTLLECNADPARRNRGGSTPLLLASKPTGRGGSGSPEAKAEQQEIVRLLEQALAKMAKAK